MMWRKRIGMALGVIIVLLVTVLFAGQAGRRLFITDTGRLDYYPTTEADSLRLCKQSGETNCEKRWFDTNGMLQWLFTHGGAIRGLTNTNKLCFQDNANDIQACFYGQGGNFSAGEITQISTGDRVSTVNNIPDNLSHTIRFDGTDAFIFDEATRTITLAANTLLAVPSWAASYPFMADAFYMQGCTLITDAPLISGGIVEPYITCGDNDAHGFHRSIAMPDSWDGGTLIVVMGVVNVNATPNNIYEVHFSAQCLRHDEAVTATIPATGEQIASINFSSACGGSACSQNDRVVATTAAITPNAAATPCTGSNRILRVQGQKNAADSMTTQVTDVKITDVKVEFTRSTLKDN